MVRSDSPGTLKAAGETARDFRAYLIERYQGEVYGEALFRALAEREGHAERRQKWRTLQQLERETKERIRPAVAELGATTEEDPARCKEGEDLAARLAAVPWDDLMKGFRTELEKFVREFEKAEELAPPEGAELARDITRHEKALLEFAVRELEGREAHSLEPVAALLRGSSA